LEKDAPTNKTPGKKEKNSPEEKKARGGDWRGLLHWVGLLGALFENTAVLVLLRGWGGEVP